MNAFTSSVVQATTRMAFLTRRNRRIVAWLRQPCFSAFFTQRAFPSSVLGPVECRQGCQARISAA
jgi:hypothetical protein